MKKKIFFGITIMVMFSVLIFAQQYDPESDFNFTRNNDGMSVIITKYVGRKQVVNIPPQIRGLPVTVIGSNAFDGSGLTSVTIPNSVSSIGSYAFALNRLTNLIIPNSVTSIGSNAFDGNRLTGVTIPNSVTSIGTGAFQGNRLTSITIPNSITSIRELAFRGNSLTSVTIPNSVTSIGTGAFQDNSLTSGTIPNSVTSIGPEAFRGNILTSIIIPNSVISIGSRAFFENNSLTAINVSENSANFSSIDGVLYNKNGTTLIFWPIGKSGAVIIPNNVTTIGAWAFAHKGLTSVTIPNNVTTIGEWAFAFNSLTSITIGNNVTLANNSFPIGGFARLYGDTGRLSGTYDLHGDVWVKW